MPFQRIFPALLACAALTGCGEGDWEVDAVTFTVRLRGLSAAEEFRVSSTSAQFIAQARAQLALPLPERRLFVTGGLHSGHGGHNQGWDWHLRDATLTQVSIGLCDGRPSMVQANLSYWINTVKSFCPWASYVHAEVE